MKANEVLEKYAAGERDFRRENLRGQSFQGQDLSGADFSEADIRGASFKNAILRDTRFCKAKAGLQKRWVIVLLLLSWITSGVSGFTSFSGRFLVARIFTYKGLLEQVFGCIALVVIIVLFTVTLRQSIEKAGTLAIGIAGVGALVLAVAGTVSGGETDANAIALGGVAGFVGVVGAGAGAGAAAVVVGFTQAVGVACAGAVGGVFAFAFAGAVAFTVAGAVALAFSKAFAGELAGVITIVLALLGTYLGWRILTRDLKDAWIRSIAIAFAATGGTSFYKADLTHADFSGATLKSTDLREANLTHSCWHNTIKLDQARPGNTILADRAIRELLVSGNGYNKSYVKGNLRGANLRGANLNKANLKLADISEATLQDANLEWANLTEAQAVGTDFTNAYFTGACLEAWNIDSTTSFTDVDCQYVFLLENPNAMGSRERRPHDSNRVFQPGDFEKLYQQVMNTVQILLRNGVNPEAFRQAFQELIAENHDISGDSIQAIERKGNDILLTLEFPESTDKGKVEREFLAVYEARLEAAKQTAMLEAERSHLKDVKEIVRAAFTSNQLSSPTINLTNTVQADNDMSDNSQSFDIDQGQANNPNNNSNLVNNSTIGGGIAGRDNKGDVIHHHAPDKNLAEAAAEIQQLLNQLSQTNSASTEIEKLTVVARAAEEIKNNPTLKAKVVNAIKAGGVEAFKEAIDHPLVNILMATIEGWTEV
ncbi:MULTISPECIES: pentapeptide repeat-containing protein [unclassified Moorena]|uniref:pentapeptide repeat-containing protein n=1 Tax=unclassified Moorena TaxID=2683338 RepID=UPI0013FEC1C2|nr:MULTISPECIES: pentapeptide repeat-containing protein [unclassified Moorena]NEO13650.1 pentapeptide repeat-containing protein [Moorena sp. SIO3E8]NEQ00074.1 pentapeptide repeat-containing protein [Moorena sp. SIO3F7]